MSDPHDPGYDPDDNPTRNFLCRDGNEHEWPAELDDGVCEVCGLPYDEWSEDPPE